MRSRKLYLLLLGAFVILLIQGLILNAYLGYKLVELNSKVQHKSPIRIEEKLYSCSEWDYTPKRKRTWR